MNGGLVMLFYGFVGGKSEKSNMTPNGVVAITLIVSK